MLTLGQLVTPTTEDEALATILTTLDQLGFQATSWQSGAIQLTVLRLFAKTWSSLSSTIALIAAGGFTTLAATTAGASAYLTLLARYVYDLERLEAQQTVGQILLTSSAGAPVTTWAAGDIIIADAAEGVDGANTYTCTAGGTLGPSSSISLEFKADVAGAAGNIAPGTTLYLWTPLVGITATNPALVPDSNTWVTTPGSDDEADARLLARCIGRWSRLTYGNTNGAYQGWALEALPALTRVTVDTAPGDGTVTIIGATALGSIDAGQITTIENYINGVADGVGRRPLNDIVTAVGAATVTTPAIAITAYAVAAVKDTIASTITAALLDYIGSLPIGGVRLQGVQGKVLLSQLISTAQAQTGVRSVSFSLTDDVSLNANEIYIPPITVTVQQVAPGI